jgi:hypothetical protein
VTITRGMMVIFNGTENMCVKKKKTNELSLVMMSVCGLRCSMEEVKHYSTHQAMDLNKVSILGRIL